MIIVPADSGLEVEAFVLNKDVGFVQPGREVQIKIQTFNFTRYGLLTGTVLDLSDDVVTQDQDRRRPCSAASFGPG
jgi:hemolysin D